ncbi:MAG: hypothetical protein ACXACD_16980 [Candidatus Thorarchaeota archaeon]|jgi:hypothetical protein
MGKNYHRALVMSYTSRRHIGLPNQESEDKQNGLERKREQARQRAKRVRESAIIAKRRGEKSLSPGIRVVGSRLLDGNKGSSAEKPTMIQLQLEVTDYLMGRGGFEITEEVLVDILSKKRDNDDIMDVRIARVVGFHDRWGLDRKFTRESAHAHRFEDGTIFEHSLTSYGGYASRTYYVVEGSQFRAFAQHNFRKSA